MHGRSFAGKWCILTLCLFILGTASFANSATVITDTTDYPPGGLVTITGAGFTSGEQVKVQVTHADGDPLGGSGHDPWFVTANGGGFVTYWIVPYDDNVGEQLLVTATGQSSLFIATTTFWDNISGNLDQLQNGVGAVDPEWANGNINSSNSCYSEGNSVPYRYFVEGGTAYSQHFFTIQFEWTKGFKHAFDYLTQYDLSEASEIAAAFGACGEPNAVPSDCATPTQSFAVPNPTTAANYSPSLAPGTYPFGFVVDGPGNILSYNASIDSVSDYVFGGSGGNLTLQFIVYYTTGPINGSAGFYWGGHLASGAANAWGAGNGSASVSGAPFHMRTLNLDGGGGANQDRSVQNGSLCLPPLVDLTCTEMDTVCQFSSYSCSIPVGADSAFWTVTGGTINSGQNTNSITYTVNNSSGNVTISVSAYNNSGGCPGDFCGADSTVSIPIKVCNDCPVATVHADTSVFLCASQQVCIPGFVCFDVDNNLTSCTATGGTLSGNSICFTPGTSGVYQLKLIAVDAYGCADTAITNVTVTINSAPVATNPPATLDTFMCAGAQICRQFSATDINGGTLTWTKLIGSGTVSSTGLWCFTASASGSYSVTATIADVCGAKDTVTMTYNVTINSVPVATNPPATLDTFMCAGAQICRQFSATDANGNGLIWTLISGSGTVSSTGLWCFTANTTGSYCVTASVADPCGAKDTVTMCYNVTINTPPVATNPPATLDTFMCAASQICRQFAATDANGGTLTWTQLTGSGTVSSTGLWCFTASGSGSYSVTATVADACGAKDTVTMTYNVTINSAPVATNPPATLDTFMCAGAQICRQFSATDVNGGSLTWTQLTGSGTISATGLWCFTSSASGSYSVSATVADACGAKDTVTMTYNVTINSAPVATNPPASVDTFICNTGTQMCRQFSATDANGNGLTWTIISGSGAVSSSGLWCFTANATGSYCVTAAVADPCGAKDTVTMCYNVTSNQPPVATNPPASIDTTLCNGAAQICRQLSATDGNGNGLVWTIISGSGTVSSSGLWCFDANTTGSYCVTASVADPCGAKDTVSMCYNLTVNVPPVATNPPATIDTFMCAAAQICRQFSASDANGNGLTWALISGSGTVSASGMWCFTPIGSGSYCVSAAVSDPCGKKDTVSICYNVTINSAPVATNPPATVDTFVCATGGQVCRQFSATDANGNGLTWAILTGTGAVSASGQWCFTITGSGSYCVTATVADPCGAKDTVTMCYNVTVNSIPVATNPPASIDTFICNAGQICRQFSATDANGNGLVWALLSGSGTVSPSGLWCFNANASGSFCVSASVTDPCGAKDTVSMCYNVTVNQPPVAVNPPPTVDTSICAPGQICRLFTATDGNGGVLVWTKLSGDGTITAQGLWCFDANASGSFSITATVADLCGAKDTVTMTYNVIVNQPPTVTLGNDQIFDLCNSQQLCISYAVSDPNGLTDILKETVISAPVGTVVDTALNKLCFTPTQNGIYTFIIEVEDKCHATDRDTATVTVTINKPPTIAFSVESTSTLMCYGQDSTICVPYTVSDPDGDKLIEILLGGAVTLDTVANTICVNSPGGGTFIAILEVTDECGASARDTVTIIIERELCCPSIAIEKVHNAYQGQQTCVSITMQDGKFVQSGGFDLLIWYDYSAMSPTAVTPGKFITDCKWEYFTYRFGATGNCGSGCPQGLIKIVAIAETNNGANHPICFSPATPDTVHLAEVCFLVTANATFECQYVPIRFFWTDCTDNALSNIKGDSLLVSDLVYDYDNPVPIDNGNAGFPTFFGTQADCLTNPGPGKPPSTSCIDFYNGGVDIVCADSIDGRGDINLNEVENEIADAVLLSRYFVYGLSMFVKNVEGQIAASDVNADGFTLSVADLVYLIRIIIGDAAPYAKLAPVAANVTIGNGSVSVDREMGAALVVVEGDQIPTLAADNMEMVSNFDGASTRILVWSQTGETFSGDFLKVDGIVAYTEFGSPEGASVTTKLVTVPTSYSLDQNYPNPFNPTTSISFTLPKATEWELGVYNVYGQLVGHFADRSEAGIVKVDWDASQFASGVYFYRLTAGEYSATKKMVLLK